MLLSPSEVQLRITAGSSGSKESSCMYFDVNTTLPLHIWEPLHEPGLQGAFVKLSLAWYFQELK
jgi:hypothetical protein